MSFEDHYNPENESEIIEKQTKFFKHLKKHKTKSAPEKAEFIMLFGSLLESKIRNKIIKEINSRPITYLDELSTLIIRGTPFSRRDKNGDNLHDQLLSQISNNERVDADLVIRQWWNLLEYEMKLSPKSLGELVSKCYSYNSPKPIFKMLSDFALFEDWKKTNQKKRNFDLHNDEVSKFIEQRNTVVHELLDTKINDADNIKNNLGDILESIIGMVENALEVRRTSIDTFKSAKKTNVDFQLNWLKKIKGDCKSKNPYEMKLAGYSTLFTKKITQEKLDSEAKYLIKKLGGDSNV